MVGGGDTADTETQETHRRIHTREDTPRKIHKSEDSNTQEKERLLCESAHTPGSVPLHNEQRSLHVLLCLEGGWGEHSTGVCSP